MAATYVASSARKAIITSDAAMTVDLAAAAEGTTRVLVVNMITQANDFASVSGWTNRYNAAHPAGGNTGRIGIWTKLVGAGGESSGTVTVGDTGTLTKATLVSLVVDGLYKRIATSQSTDWTVSHVVPTALLDAADDLSIMVAAAAQYNRTWTWPSGSTEIDETSSTGEPDLSIAHRAVSGSSTGTVTATANSVEQHHTANLIFYPATSTGTADFAGVADTVAISSVALGGGAVVVAASATADREVTVLGTGGVPIEGAVVTLALVMPSGSASVATAPPTDVNGKATITITGGTATTPGQSGTLTASIAGTNSNTISIEVSASLSANSVRVSSISTKMVGGADTPTTGWFAWVFAAPTVSDDLLGTALFKASDITLVSDGAGAYKAEFGVPTGVSVSVSDVVRVILRRSQTVAVASPTEESGVMNGVVL
jgi:hypothetical protein